jgi:serine/threonine protein phosphatase PrpC
VFIKKSKAYVGHVGDSGLLLGFGDSYHNQWNGKKLTRVIKNHN